MERVIKMINSINMLIYLIYNNRTNNYIAYSIIAKKIVNRNISEEEIRRNFSTGFWRIAEE